MGFIAVVVAGTCRAENPQDLKSISAKGFKLSTSADYVSLVAEVLPLPGQYAGDTWNHDGQFKGILLMAGTDNTKDIQLAGTNPAEIQKSDIFVLGQKSRFHISWSEQEPNFEITLVPLPNGKGDRKVINLLEALHKGRVVRLVGEFDVALANSRRPKGEETLKLVCGPSAMCWFDAKTGKIMWQDISMGAKPVSGVAAAKPPAAAKVKSPLTKPGAVILDQDFAKPEANGTWHRIGGRWSVKDGVLVGSALDGKSAAMTYPFPCRDVVLNLRFQLVAQAPLIVHFENEKGPFCGVLVFANSRILQKCEPQTGSGHKLKFVDLAKKLHKLDPDYLYNLTIRLCGEEFSAEIEKGASVSIRNPVVNADKTGLGIIFSGGIGRLYKIKAVVPEN
jgi:hypothetical protein